jgi:hypothetical protein
MTYANVRFLLFLLILVCFLRFCLELETVPPLVLQEFTSKQDFNKEFCMDVYADSSVLANKDFKGLIFSIY